MYNTLRMISMFLFLLVAHKQILDSRLLLLIAKPLLQPNAKQQQQQPKNQI